MRESLMCPSYGAKMFEGGDPTDLQDSILALLEAADIPSTINDQIMILVERGERELESLPRD